MSAKLTVTREIAYDAFTEVMDHRRNPDDVIDRLFSEQKRPVKRLDRNFVKEIVYGGLRWYSKIYWIVQKTASRDLSQASPAIRAALVLGTYQIFYMDRVPDRAAVNESVEYIRKKGQANAVKFVNGILRSIARRAEYFAKPDKEKQPVDYLALQFAHPSWIVERWHRRFSFERMRELLAANNQPPPYSVRINCLKTNNENIQELRSLLLKEDKNHSERQALRSCLHLKAAPNMEEGSLFARGYYTVQDEASQLIGHMVAPQAGELIIDACCGPGGKLTHIFELAGGACDLIGVERDALQLRKAQDNYQRLGHPSERITWVEADFLNFKPARPPQRILLDAPCSGLGVLRRHPEGKWQKTGELIGQMAAKQRELIKHALSLLESGGELIFSVCSFELEETSEQLAWILKEFPDMIDVVSPLERLPDYYKRFVTRDLVLLIFSGNKDGMDGFGSFIIRKR